MGRKIGTILLTILFAVSVTFMGYAFWTIQSRTDNVLTMASYKAQIVEEYNVPAHVNPSETVQKKVHGYSCTRFGDKGIWGTGCGRKAADGGRAESGYDRDQLQQPLLGTEG